MKTSWLLVLSLVVTITPHADAQPMPTGKPESVGMSSQRLERIGQVLRQEIDQGRLPGAVVAIARKGTIVYLESFGFLDKGAGTPMPKDAIFGVASLTKPLTAVGALTLYEDGRLQINDPMGKYLPALDSMPVAVMSPDGQKVIGTEPARRRATLQDLMRHTAGVTYGNRGTSDLHKTYDALNLNQLTGPEFLDHLGKLPLHYQPGTTWDYSLGFDVLGLIVESISNQSLGRYLEERVFKPLGMVDTAFIVPTQKIGRYAKPFPKDPLTGIPQAWIDKSKTPTIECGGACAVSTATDYLRFAQMLLNRGSLNNTRMLGRKTVEFMTADQLGPEVNIDRLRQYPNINGYGFGLSVAVRRASGVAGIMGSPGDYNWGGATGPYFWVDPKEELAVVFMAAAPGELRVRNRQLITSLVLQAIAD